MPLCPSRHDIGRHHGLCIVSRIQERIVAASNGMQEHFRDFWSWLGKRIMDRLSPLGGTYASYEHCSPVPATFPQPNIPLNSEEFCF
jgi:hypothetical protein